MKFHEYAEIYRMLPDAELQSLAEDIRQKGQLLPITIYEGKVLDGRNRYRACEIAGVEPKMEVYDGNDPLGLIASLNDHRRHDSENERALVGARMANLRKGEVGRGRASIDAPTGAPIITIERAAELSGSSKRNIQRAKPIVQSGIQELQDMADSGEISIRAASEVAKLPEDEQRKAVSGGVAGVKEAAKKSSLSKRSVSSDCPESESEPSEKTAQETCLNLPSNSNKRKRLPKWKPDDAERLWLLAKTDLDKILPSDISRERVLKEVVKYAQNRIQKNI